MSTSSASQPAKKFWRAAIIGCGQIAGGYDLNTPEGVIQTHAKAYQLHPRVELVAIADPDGGRADQFARFWGVPEVYREAKSMLEGQCPEIVSICTPDETHEIILAQCLDQSSVKAVWCEKPLALDPVKAEELVREFQSRGVLLAVNYLRRWDPRINEIGEAIRSGRLGQIQKVIGCYTKGICHNGSHLVDLIQSWFGHPDSEQVVGFQNDFSPDDPTVDAVLSFGDTTVYLIGLDDRDYSLFEVDVIGTLGRVKMERFGFGVSWSEVVTDPDFAGHHCLEAVPNLVQTELQAAMGLALDEIIRALESGGQVRSNGVTALVALQTCHRLAVLALEGKTR